MSRKVFIVGASRGLGREFVEQYAAAGCEVVAGVRKPGTTPLPEGVREIQIDVANEASVKAAADELTGPLDLLVICAGAFGAKNEHFETPTTADLDVVMRANVLGPIALIETFAPRISAARGTVAVLTSRMGSIGDAGSPYGLLYRCSKAAANMVVKCASEAYARDGARIIALHPGWVRTDMGGPQAPLEAPESIAGMRTVIDDETGYPGGGFYTYQGETLPW